ncbi:MAG: TonB-dependent receptor [Acidobacteria bacterium]|nr:TonB-dependent receptor [Acidobacteriota bacterium]
MNSTPADRPLVVPAAARRRASGNPLHRLAVTAAAVLCLGAPSTAAAQTGSLTGTVTDAQGAGVPGATVTAEPAPGPGITVMTDASGGYMLVLDPGTYTVTITLSGFETQFREGVQIAAGETNVVDVMLPVAAIAEQVDVVGVTPLPGVGVDRDRVAAPITVIDGSEFADRGAASMADALNERLGAVTLEGMTTNLFQPTLRFRGFTASPLLGLPQGIAVYQNGVRINEPFGDTVQFDLMPQFALDRVQLSAGSDPTYGLNALGGALALDLKNGFDNSGFGGEFSGGSFGRLTTTAEYGANTGPWAFYGGVTHFTEDGWRVESPSEVTQAFADVGYRDGGVDAGISVTYADTLLTGNAAAPVELLDISRSAVFTFPDQTENRLGFVQGRANVAASDVWSVQITGYYRDLDRRTLNGDEAEFGACEDDALPAGAPEGTLCVGADYDDDDDHGHADDHGHDHADEDADDDHHADDDDDDDHGHDDDDDHDEEEEATPLVDLVSGRFITLLDAAGDGAYNRTTTLAQGYGATVQATATTGAGSRENVFVLGVSADLADVAFESSSEPGSLTADRGVLGSGLLTSLYGLGGDDLFNTKLETANTAFGLYISDTLSLSEQFHVTVSGRYNRAGIDIVDLLGTSLNGSHTFGRFNPAVGAVFQADENTSFFARYSESNRAPTAAELSCADPAEPCRVPNAFVADPPLEQAVARSFDMGVRGRWRAAAGRGEWSVAAYRTRIDDDILFIASPELIGTGYFQNAGATARSGLDVELSGGFARTGWYLSYGLVDATFESSLMLPSDEEVNDAATDEGVAVAPGDRLPGIPRHSLKLGVRQDLTDAWDLALEAVVSSSRFFLGDEGNDQVPLEGYGVVNLRSAYRFDNGVELFARVENLLDARYATSGVLAELEVFLREVPNASVPRFIGPGVPRSAFGGVRVRF